MSTTPGPFALALDNENSISPDEIKALIEAYGDNDANALFELFKSAATARPRVLHFRAVQFKSPERAILPVAARSPENGHLLRAIMITAFGVYRAFCDCGRCHDLDEGLLFDGCRSILTVQPFSSPAMRDDMYSICGNCYFAGDPMVPCDIDTLDAREFDLDAISSSDSEDGAAGAEAPIGVV